MEAVANDAEIEYRQLGRIERDEGNSTIITLLKIAGAMKIDMYQFFLFLTNDTNINPKASIIKELYLS